MPASIFNADSVKLLKDILKFKTGKRIVNSNVDPTSVAQPGEPGDVLINTSKIYIKQDSGTSANWNVVIDDSELASQLSNYILLTEKGAPNGVATLDGGGKVPVAQLPSAVMTLEGPWNASTNTPTLTNGSGDPGMVYEVTVAGTTDFGAGPITFAVGDWAVYAANGQWYKSLNSNAVTSVFGRTGTVTAQSGDYNASEVEYTPAGTISATDVEGAINQLDTGKADITLGNLSPTTGVNSNLLPDGSPRNLGSSSNRWDDLFVNKIEGVLTSNYLTTAGTQAVTNKDIDGGTAANNRRITLPKDTLTNLNALTRKQGTVVYDTTGDRPLYDNGSILVPFSTNSNPNLISDGDAESGTTNFITGSYAAATRPSGTFTPSSGTGLFEIATTTSSPLFGATSFQLTQVIGASRQGRAIERTIAIDAGYRSKVLQMQIDYQVVSGSWQAGSATNDSSMIWYIAQSSNGTTFTMTEPSSFKMLAGISTIPDRLIGNFQVNSDTTHIKLIAYIPTATSSGWTVKCEVGIYPCDYVYGTPITDWQSWTPTGDWTTNTTYTGRWRRVGNVGEYNVTIELTGAPPALACRVNNPPGHVFDTSKMPSPVSAYLTTVKGQAFGVNGGSQIAMIPSYSSNTGIVLTYLTSVTTGASANVTATAPVTWANTNAISVQWSAPIVGWDGTTQMSDGYDAREVSASFSTNAGAIGTSAGTWTTVTFSTPDFDTVSGWNGSDTYTARTSGTYEFGLMAGQNSGTANYFRIGYRINGGTDVVLGQAIGKTGGSAYAFGVRKVRLTAGETIQFRALTEGTEGVGATRSAFIKKEQAPTTLTATETIAALATGDPASVSSGNPFIVPTVQYDTHGSYNATTGRYTCTSSGFFKIYGALTSASSATTLSIYKNGSLYCLAGNVDANGEGTFAGSVQCVAGDIIDLRPGGTVDATSMSINFERTK